MYKYAFQSVTLGTLIGTSHEIIVLIIEPRHKKTGLWVF